MHDIRGEKGQDTEEEKPAVPVEDWANVLEEPADGLPRATIGFGCLLAGFCNGSAEFASGDTQIRRTIAWRGGRSTFVRKHRGVSGSVNLKPEDTPECLRRQAIRR